MKPLPSPGDLIPQSPPFLMLDRIEVLEPERVVARKRFDAREPFYQGHFPGSPITPGMFLCECVHQAGAALVAGGQEVALDGVPVLTRVYGTQFRGTVPPGAEVEIEVVLEERIAGVYLIRGRVHHQGRLVLRHRCALGMLSEGELAA